MPQTARPTRISRRTALALAIGVLLVGNTASAASKDSGVARLGRLRDPRIGDPRIYVREAERALASGDSDLAYAMIALAYLAFDAGEARWTRSGRIRA